ncbi:hypothetical protein [Hydrogenophaga sp.]|uniref:hypothetical protein n=1 Tax=Hydrogenophaga sp. TaxID=1904254 RepID=UPI00272F424A|nr:hypothetical protein [Hydrogenophaga sp.]MDP2016766.1 hypothetical protein [Hydrogenophaga sp.]MDP3165497.1 hypothetical protein [Hydrogenophaga sp.]MDP3810716.1 hypothetical protein [Hydrogenophaga sp.]
MLSIPAPLHSDTPPKAQSTVQTRRHSLSFSVERLSRRNEIVLKSSMRVLDHRFLHEWTTVESGGDVRVYTHAPSGNAGSDAALQLDSDDIASAIVVQLPLRTQDIEFAFNRMGDALVRIRQAQGAGVPQALRDDEVLRLQRWPSDVLLNTQDRLTLAAVMSARPCSVETLQGRSALPMDTCRAFMRDLMNIGLLVPAIETTKALSKHSNAQGRPSWPKSAPPPRGLLARIRARLGLPSNGWR